MMSEKYKHNMYKGGRSLSVNKLRAVKKADKEKDSD